MRKARIHREITSPLKVPRSFRATIDDPSIKNRITQNNIKQKIADVIALAVESAKTTEQISTAFFEIAGCTMLSGAFKSMIVAKLHEITRRKAQEIIQDLSSNNISIVEIMRLQEKAHVEVMRIFKLFQQYDSSFMTDYGIGNRSIEIVASTLFSILKSKMDCIVLLTGADLEMEPADLFSVCIKAKEDIDDFFEIFKTLYCGKFDLREIDLHKKRVYEKIEANKKKYVDRIITRLIEKSIEGFSFGEQGFSIQKLPDLRSEVGGKLDFLFEELKNLDESFCDENDVEFFAILEKDSSIKKYCEGKINKLIKNSVSHFSFGNEEISYQKLSQLRAYAIEKVKFHSDELKNHDQLFFYGDESAFELFFNSARIMAVNDYLKEKIYLKAKKCIASTFTGGRFLNQELFEKTLYEYCGSLCPDQYSLEDTQFFEDIINDYFRATCKADLNSAVQNQKKILQEMGKKDCHQLVLFESRFLENKTSFFQAIVIGEVYERFCLKSNLSFPAQKKYVHVAFQKLFLKPYASIAEAIAAFDIMVLAYQACKSDINLKFCEPKQKNGLDYSEYHAQLLLSKKRDELMAIKNESTVKNNPANDLNQKLKAQLEKIQAQLEYRKQLYRIREKNGYFYATNFGSIFGEKYAVNNKMVEAERMHVYVAQLLKKVADSSYDVTLFVLDNKTTKNGKLSDIYKEIQQVAKQLFDDVNQARYSAFQV